MEKLLELMKNLTVKERESLKSVVTALYFKEEYEAALWEVVITMLSEEVTEEGIDIKDILSILDPNILEEQ
jgi:hypothetical protein